MPIIFACICFAIAAAILIILFFVDRARRRMPLDAYDGNWGGHQ